MLKAGGAVLEDEIVEMHAIIKGQVQGVFFRATTRQMATELGLTGTVRNVPDGTVEIFAQGTRKSLDRLIEQLVDESGPGHVEEVEKAFLRPVREFPNFRIIH